MLLETWFDKTSYFKKYLYPHVKIHGVANEMIIIFFIVMLFFGIHSVFLKILLS